MTLAPPKDAVYYEQLYQTHDDPWAYAQAAEQAKYRLSLETARRWQSHPNRVLEVACSLGYLTEQLAGYAPDVYGFDVSETAVREARARCQRRRSATQFHLTVGAAAEPAYPNGFFEVVFMQDVLLEITDDPDLRRLILRRSLQLLAPGGVLVLTDYQHPDHQAAYVALAEELGGRVVEKLYFHDRFWFRLRGSLKAIRRSTLAKRLLESSRVYRALARWAARRGPQGSKHFGLVVQRKL